MTGPNSSEKHSEHEEIDRPRVPLPTPSNVVDLGTDVGTEPPTGLPSSEFGASEPHSPDRGEWEVVDGTSRELHGESRRRSVGTHTSEFSDGPPGVGEYSARTYRADDALAVIAELPEVDEADLSTGIDVRSNRFVVSVRGRTVDRVPLPWESTAVAVVRFEDGVLEARLEPAECGRFGTGLERCV